MINYRIRMKWFMSRNPDEPQEEYETKKGYRFVSEK